MDSTKKSTLLNVLKIILAVVGAFFVVLAMFNLPADLKSLTLEDQNGAMNSGYLNLMTNFTIFIVILGAVLILAFFAYGLITDTKKSLKSVLGYALSGVGFLLFYVIAKGTATPFSQKEGIATSTLKATEAGIYLTIAMVLVGFFLMLVGGLFKYIKK